AVGGAALSDARRDALRRTTASEDPEAKLYAACALLHDAEAAGSERRHLLGLVRGSPVLSALSTHTWGDGVLAVTCGAGARADAGGDDAAPRYVGTRCMACS